MTILSVLAMLFGITAALSLFPQAYKIFKRKSAKDISVITYLVLLTSSFIWVLYGIEINSFPVIISNSLAAINLILIIAGWFRYGR